MVGWIAIAAVAMICAVIAQHLGLTKAIADVVTKVAACPKCCALWLTLAVLLLAGANWLIAVSLSILMSYLSHYFGLVLMVLQKIYNKLWERINV